MSPSPVMLTSATVRELASRRVVVVGDILLDRFTDAHEMGPCREGPAPAVRPETVRSCPGGAANVAANLAGLGASVELVGVVGEDAAGGEVLGLLTEQGVGLAGVVVDRDRATPLLNRVRADGQLLVRVDEGSDGGVSEATARQLADRLACATRDTDAVIVSDYDRGTIGDAVLARIGRVSSHGDALVAVDARQLSRYRAVRPTVVTPNWAELLSLVDGATFDGRSRPQAVAERGRHILHLAAARTAAVTLDREGAVVLEAGRHPHRTFTRPTGDDRAMGAGDTFVAALTLGLTSGLTPACAGELAAAAAGVVLGNRHTDCCTATMLSWALSEAAKVVAGPDALGRLARELHASGQRVVFTHGRFGPLARADMARLAEVRTCGDVLMVGAEDGHGFAELAALSCVDHIVALSDTTRADVLATLRPHLTVDHGSAARLDGRLTPH